MPVNLNTDVKKNMLNQMLYCAKNQRFFCFEHEPFEDAFRIVILVYWRVVAFGFQNVHSPDNFSYRGAAALRM